MKLFSGAAFSAIFLLTAGCADVARMTSDDPEALIGQYMMEIDPQTNGTHPPVAPFVKAIPALNKAFDIYLQRGDQLGIATVYTVASNVPRIIAAGESYQEATAGFEQKYGIKTPMAKGDYRPMYELLYRAGDMFQRQGNHVGYADTLAQIANQTVAQNKATGCQYYAAAKSNYEYALANNERSPFADKKLLSSMSRHPTLESINYYTGLYCK